MQNKFNITIKKPTPKPKYNLILKKFKTGNINPNKLA